LSTLTIETAKVFKPLLTESRYKGAFGGRGSGKSHFFAGLLVEEHVRNPGLRSVCIREVQKSLRDSAKKLIDDKIKQYNLESHGFKSFRDVIKTPGDGFITFMGMQDHTAESIKSLEGFGRAWVEEAQTLSERSLQMLRPTIRTPGSEIWFSWNPRRKTDPVDAFLRAEEPPSNSIVVRANWDDNPWFTDELEAERLDDMRMNPDQYEHVWNGDYITVQKGAYFAEAISTAKREGRIGKIGSDPLMSFKAFFDIGGTGAKADACAIWIAQFIGKEIRVVNYYEAVGQELSAHVAWLREKGYGQAEIYLPHDGVRHDSVYNVTFESALRQAGFHVEVIANQGTGAAKQRIEALRRIFLRCWFDKDNCSAGLDALGWYHEKWDEVRGIGLGPEHDWSSHSCLIAGTMINTAQGLIPIENVKKGDKVITPNGEADVSYSGKTKVSDELIELTFSNGSVLICTPEHKVFTISGVVCADAVRYNDIILTEELSWKLSVRKNKGYREDFIENLKESDITSGVSEVFIVRKEMVNNHFCTGIYGFITIKRFLLNTLLSLLGTGKTLILKIGFASHMQKMENSSSQKIHFKHIKTSIITGLQLVTLVTGQVVNLCTELSGKITMVKYLKEWLSTIKIGINQTMIYPILNYKPKAITVSYMQKQINGLDLSRIKNNCCKHKKKQRNGIEVKKVENGIESMEKNAGKTRQNQKKYVPYARENTKHTILRDQSIAVEVVKIKCIEEKVPVYDLTVEKDHCYFANGVLVSNSDSAGLMALVAEQKTREQKRVVKRREQSDWRT